VIDDGGGGAFAIYRPLSVIDNIFDGKSDGKNPNPRRKNNAVQRVMSLGNY